MLEFIRAHDYLMQICIDNVSRTGALANMTLGKFGNAKYTGESYFVSVLNHKTVGARGPADITLTSSLNKEAHIYSLNFRNELEGIGLEKENTFFISYSRKKMSSSMVTVQLNSYWSKTVCRTEARPRFHMTLVRKSAVTKTYVWPNLENDLVSLMCHSRKMQKETYLCEDKHKNTVATSQQLLEDLHSTLQRVFAEEIADGKITFTLVKAKRVQIPSFRSMTDLQKQDKVRSIIRVKVDGGNITQDKEELLPGN